MDDNQRQTIVDLLRISYNMEIETVANYLANSIHLDGFKAKHIKDALAADIQEELTHATQLAQRIKVLEGRVPGSQELSMAQTSLQPPENQLDVLSVIHGVIDAEQGAIDQYQTIIEATDGIDPVTQDLCIALKGDEEEHRRLFKGFLAEMLADQ
ncbi:ferritin-like domain-containing protein [Algisphaera agarilytica]|uniref:Bacterioferritin n=1 Tax=Algisphaera agarilytica TaxID=1385975 RepID=A0A7X0H7P5_9BACT|nr:ferritin-like domain-containing protein [Algisphaera agarilytica]MBB6429339.1 bacterioferritin [Algisphaera agarilytica]